MTPETTALVERLRDAALGCSFAGNPAKWPHADMLTEAADRLSQERTCSTCRHGHRHGDILFVTCEHDESPVDEVPNERAKTWGCLLWKQADPKEESK